MELLDYNTSQHMEKYLDIAKIKKTQQQVLPGDQ